MRPNPAHATTDPAAVRDLIPEVLGEEENLATLTRLVERFERRVEKPLYLDQEWGRQVAKGTVGLRIPVARFVCKRKLSQDKEREWEAELAAAATEGRA